MFKINGLKFADKGFYINLDKSLDRRNNINKLIEKHDIENLERFSALQDDWLQFSCTKSHLKVFEQSIVFEYDSIFVAEDDMDIRDLVKLPYVKNPIEFNQKLIEIHNDLENTEWDIVLLGCNPKTYLIPITDTLAQVNKSTGAWGYIIKKNAYKFILENLNYRRDLLAIDDFLPRMNNYGFKTLCTIPMMIHHSVGFESTLQPRGPVNYDSWIEGNYQKFLFDFYDGNSGNFELERNLTILLNLKLNEDTVGILRTLVKLIPQRIRRCRFLLNLEEEFSKNLSQDRFNIFSFFRDEENEINVDISFNLGDLTFNFEQYKQKINTVYFIVLDENSQSLVIDGLNFDKFINSFENDNSIFSIKLDSNNFSDIYNSSNKSNIIINKIRK